MQRDLAIGRQPLLLNMAFGPFVPLRKGMLSFACTSGYKYEALYMVQSLAVV